jgi:RNA-directed DNA polymerase
VDWAGDDKLGLTLNEAKTSIQNARQESFDFLGYRFGPHRYRKDGHWYLGASPSKKSVQRLKEKVGKILVPGNQGKRQPLAAVFSLGQRPGARYFDQCQGSRVSIWRIG